MGYTHYWTVDPRQVTPRQFAAFAMDAKRVIATAGDRGIPIAGPHGYEGTHPEFSEGVISMNGLGDDSHETLYMDFTTPTKPTEPKPELRWPNYDDPDMQKLAYGWQEYEEFNERGGVKWTFCKTARKPYDAAAGAILMRAKHHFGDAIEVGSDGDYNSEQEWGDAKNLYAAAFDEKPFDPLHYGESNLRANDNYDPLSRLQGAQRGSAAGGLGYNSRTCGARTIQGSPCQRVVASGKSCPVHGG